MNFNINIDMSRDLVADAKTCEAVASKNEAGEATTTEGLEFAGEAIDGWTDALARLAELREGKTSIVFRYMLQKAYFGRGSELPDIATAIEEGISKVAAILGIHDVPTWLSFNSVAKPSPTERKILSHVAAAGTAVDATAAAAAGETMLHSKSRSRRFGVVLDMLGRKLLHRGEDGRITITPAGLAAIGKAEKDSP